MLEANALLLTTAASIGVIHTLIGPDHYLPFITLARAREWTLARTVAITAISGLGHVAGSLALGAVALGLGWALGGVERIEAVRGDLAGWLLLAFGLAYLAWGVRQALRSRSHSHRHAHADGTVHEHPHTHRGHHAHLHEARGSRRPLGGATAWSLFVVFILGPCEPLIPLLAYPAAAGSGLVAASVALVFALATVGTMIAVVVVGRVGLGLLPLGRWERWSHAVAGVVVVACGLAVQFGL
jgi:sulfite exporter TauE/SafE